ncbi:molybdate ABC transporter substrate-binding protein [Peptostreptococcus anaerobius]|uniref:Molybdate ABC transporter substrate-binding protein n=1 Tax=Peptostreptococcus porci TaxID=2652282 RepID=A0A6N7XHE5_9FIRM|nr:molybdate ABC transporter substrate-binding protein [Peptostreptococcus porci]MDD7182173.1 molybdate ABC transporter substrate-binding protein [Peptostreptococcus porci]MDY4128380.1 molybdate ABC transporter substrate-binding protein [Peptostreptococcus porci]MDY5964826.1 molybdate ABC transporter substrate-binding protein [Peptostreptococcus porci]MST62767.1 molybdate ABC transporter substrate-binding protein [Peptostreptococcus porci]
MKLGHKFKVLCLLLALIAGTTLTACTKKDTTDEKATEAKKEVNLFIAASLSDAVGELVKDFEAQNADVKVVVNADSSGKLKSQIMEGFDCDIFLSASTKEIKELNEKGMLVDNSTMDLLQNQLAIIAYKDYDSAVKELDSVKDAKSIALPYGSVPAGFYARKALIADGILKVENQDNKAVKAITGKTVSEALGGITISEKENVSVALSSVAEKSTEIGFVYVSDVKRNENVKIVSTIDVEKTGKITYPIAKVKSKKDTKDKAEIIDKLYKALSDDKAKKVYEKYGFKVD